MGGGEWISHNGINVFCMDWSYLKDQEYRDAVSADVKMFLDTFSEKTGKITVLADVTRSVINKETLETIKDSTSLVEPYCAKIAVLGIEGMKKVLLSAVNQISKLGIKPFSSKEEALDWLIK